MTRGLGGLKPVVEALNPRNARTLAEAGALDASSLLGLGRTLPWLIGRGQSLGILSQAHAHVIGSKPALIDVHGTVTWKELDQRANRAAHFLWAQGIRPGDKVGLLLRNGREIAELILAAQKLGVIAAPFNTWAKPKELQVTIEGAEPAVLVYDTRHSDQVRGVAHDHIPLLHVGDGGSALPRSTGYEEALEHQPATPPAPFTRARGTPKVIIHTSGTTGKPKGAARDTAAAGIGALTNILRVVPYHRDDVVFCPTPMFHSFGLATFVFSTAIGATLLTPDRFDAEDSLDWMERHRATAASFVPVMLRRIVSLPEEVKRRYDVSSIRIILASGSVLSEDVRRGAIELFGHVLYDLYGSTEIGWVAIATPDDMKNRPKTVGKPVPGIELAVLGADGRRLPPGHTGELYIKSEVLFEGYTSGEAKDVREGYMTIGDLGRIDDDGYVYVESRADDMVVVGGENVYPVEIERTIEDMPDVSEVAVVGVEDEEYGHVLAAFVVGTVSEDDVIAACKKELASYKVPRRVQVMDELPRNATGKVLKRKLAATLSGAEPLDD